MMKPFYLKSSTKPLVSSWSVSNAEHLWCLLQVLEAQTKPSNCSGLAALAELHHCKSLSNVDTEKALKHYEEVISCDEFLCLCCDQLKQLISWDGIRVPSEETVYNSVLQWVATSWSRSTIELFASVMSCVWFLLHLRIFYSADSSRITVRTTFKKQFKYSPEKVAILWKSPRTKLRKPCGLQDVSF